MAQLGNSLIIRKRNRVLTIIFMAALVLTVTGIASARLFTIESYKVYGGTNDPSNVQGENQFNNPTTNNTFSIK